MDKQNIIRSLLFMNLSLSILLLSNASASVIYSGYDIGSISLAASPNATSAASSFDLAVGPMSVIDFESELPDGIKITGGLIGDASVVCYTPDLHGYATSPVNVYRNNGAILEFDNPIDSFGAYFTGWQIINQTLTLGYSNGDTEILAMPAGVFSEGGTLFFGFTNSGSSIIKITYTAGTSGSDAVAFDDVRFRTVVPIPNTSWLFVYGLISLIGFNRLKKSSQIPKS
jgi:hypothetical protein